MMPQTAVSVDGQDVVHVADWVDLQTWALAGVAMWAVEVAGDHCHPLHLVAGRG